MMREKVLFLSMGILFGFLLSRAGATTPDYYVALFLFEDGQLAMVIGGAVMVAALGIAWMKWRRSRVLLSGEAIAWPRKPLRMGVLPGSVLFGVGWGLAGSCPGTALAMLGEGRLSQLFVLAGMLLGTWVYGIHEHRLARLDTLLGRQGG